jgi:hypothetical protein
VLVVIGFLVYVGCGSCFSIGRRRAFSGLTGVFKIGTPAQRVRLGLDFREDEILVLDPPLCPPFVRLCF